MSFVKEIDIDAAIMSLWRTRRYDTQEIAVRLGLKESEDYNRIMRAREAAQ